MEPARTRPLFGVIGGLGPVATARLHTAVVTLAADVGAVADTDFPALLIASAPAVGLDAAGRPGPGFVAATQHTIDLLTHAGAEILVAACNTLDAYRDQLAIPDHVRYVSAVECAAREVAASTGPVGVLTSATSRGAALYDRALPGRTVLYAPDQDAVDSTIATGMAGRLHPEDLRPLIGALRDRGADQVILGCTELHLPTLSRIQCHTGTGTAGRPTVVDSVAALARRIVKESL